MSDAPTQVADGVLRLGTRLVNWYLVEEDGRVTVVDCGLPRYYDQLEPGLAVLGRGLDDVAAVVLTHGDGDHVGFAERLRAASGTPVSVHEDDVRITTTNENKKRESSLLPYLRHGAALQLIAHFAANGGLKPPPVASSSSTE